MDSQDDTLKVSRKTLMSNNINFFELIFIIIFFSQVVRVWHIENNSLWTKYAASHKTIKAKLPYGETSYSKINNSFSLRSMRSISTLVIFFIIFFFNHFYYLFLLI